MFTFNYAYQELGDIQIHTTGCDLSIHDGRKFAATLPIGEKAMVFNTCSVFVERETENRILLRILRKAYPEYKLYVLGCDVNNNPSNYVEYDNVYRNEVVSDIINRHFVEDRVESRNDIVYLKIQDGCRHNCTFCIINQLRNNPFSLPYREIVNNLRLEIGDRKEVKVQVAGTELTNYYDKETGYRISDVLEHLVEEFPEIIQLALTSIDPASNEIEKIMRIIDKNRDRLIPHLNLAVQSGNDYILKMMKRRHDVQRIREVHALGDKYDIGLGWDIIVGFPGETEEYFMDTVNLIRELKPLTRTMFAYSPRKGTPAYEMKEQIQNIVKQERLCRVVEEVNACILEASDARLSAYRKYIDERFNDAKQGMDVDMLSRVMFNGMEHVELDLFDEDMFANWLRYGDKSKLVYINYDLERALETDIYVNFIKGFVKGSRIAIRFPKEYDIDNHPFKDNFPCIVRKKSNIVIIV